MAKELFWSIDECGDQTARGKLLQYSVRPEKRGRDNVYWAVVLTADGSPWEAHEFCSVGEAKAWANDYADRAGDFPTMLVTRNDGERVIVEINPDPGNLATRVMVELSIHHTGVVTVDMDANSRSNIDVDVFGSTALIVRDGEFPGSDSDSPRPVKVYMDIAHGKYRFEKTVELPALDAKSVADMLNLSPYRGGTVFTPNHHHTLRILKDLQSEASSHLGWASYKIVEG